MKNLMSKVSVLGAMILAAGGYAQEQGPPPARPEQGYWNTFVMIGIAIVFFYLILWRPEQKKRKVLEQRRNTLKKGDKVTAMGIVGTVSKVEDNTVILKMVDGSKIEVLKAAVNEVLPAAEDNPFQQS
ncbi:MAG: preprotein translocase subunit YajC [Chlamydiota bacterium]